MKLVCLNSCFSHLPHSGSPELLLASLPCTSWTFPLSSPSTSGPALPSWVYTAHCLSLLLAHCQSHPPRQMRHPHCHQSAASYHVVPFAGNSSRTLHSITHRQNPISSSTRFTEPILASPFWFYLFPFPILNFMCHQNAPFCPEYRMLLGSSLPLLLWSHFLECPSYQHLSSRTFM